MKRRARQLAVPRPHSGMRLWALVGALLGGLAGVIAFAPAAWLAAAIGGASGQHLLLADARGTVWSGSAVVVLTGGPGSRSASALPGRLQWTLFWRDGAFELRPRQACCLRGEPSLRLQPGLGRWQLELRPAGPGTGPADRPLPLGQWPAGWLAGLGTPWNTLQLDGELRLATPGLRLDVARGRWRISGAAELELADVASRLSTLPTLGSYRLRLDGRGEQADLALTTLAGALRLNVAGQWGEPGLRLRGEASAAPGAEAALSNLLNIIGRRQGERSLIAIG
jgi:general secretion pathway protein N